MLIGLFASSRLARRACPHPATLFSTKSHGTACIVGAVGFSTGSHLSATKAEEVARLAYQKDRVRFVLVKQNTINFPWIPTLSLAKQVRPGTGGLAAVAR
jgi:hypothetical protein